MSEIQGGGMSEVQKDLKNTVNDGNNKKFCRDCGKPIAQKAVVCPKCGTQQEELKRVKKNERTRLAAALFAIFLGGFGAHRFYIGKTVSGVFYLLFCWTFIPSIIAFVEFFIFLVMSDETFDKKYN